MARHWITSLLFIALIGTVTGTCEAQTGAAKKSGVSSLSAKLAQMRDSLRGKSADDVPDEVPTFVTDKPASRQQTPAAANTRSQVGESLPLGLFGRNNDVQSSRDVFQDDHSDFDTSPRVGSAIQTQNNNVARRSPVKKEYNELEEALAELARENGESFSEDPSNDDEVSFRHDGTEDFLASDEMDLTRSDESDATFEYGDDEHLTDEERLKSLAQQRRVPQVSQSSNQRFDLHQALIRDSSAASETTKSPQNDSANEESARSKAEAREKSRDFSDKLKNFPGDDNPASSRLQSESDSNQTTTSVAGGSTKRAPIAQEAPGRITLSSQQPVIISHIEGPRQVLVGQEATFRVTLENTSNANAQRLLAEVRIPEGAEVVEAICTSGVVEREEASAGMLKWQMQEIAAGKSQTLTLRLIPRTGQAMQLGVQWTQAPVASQTMVEVQEPKLNIAIDGPEEVLFDKPQRYKLTLSNPGTGIADSVVIQLIPPGRDENSMVTHPVGALQPGEKKVIELELTAREAGDLVMTATATASGGLHSEALKQIVCQKAELELDWRGTEEMYAGTSATYFIRVRNPGTAKTDDVTVSVALPEGAKFKTASEGHKLDPKSGSVQWKLKGIAPGEAKIVQVRCHLDRAGMNEFVVKAGTSTGELTDSSQIATKVVAVADLKLTVLDPSGPKPVGESVVYEVRVLNRGTSNAENVNVVGLFSDGIDPTTVEGAEFSIRDGRVTIHPIKSLPAGHELILKIRAVAAEEGTHIFRAEVTCQDLEVKLASEETTRYYKEEFRWEDGETPYTAEQGEKTVR